MTLKSAALAAIVSCTSWAQVNVQITGPSISFGAPPPVVVVEPGVQVVEDSPDEVFYVDNVYWVRRGPHWYRANDHRGGWVVVDGPGVPPALVHMPPGKYRHFKKGKSVVVNPPGPGKVKIKGNKHH